jgi:hypothetical protein
MHPFEALPDSLRSAFDDGHNKISFAIREKEYLFLAEYDERPFVKGMLFVADEEPEIWTAIADSGEEYVGDDPPEPWKGLPGFMAEKIAWAANLHVLSTEQ